MEEKDREKKNGQTETGLTGRPISMFVADNFLKQ